jgi:hypothetical protein
MRDALVGVLAIALSIPAYWALRLVRREKAPDPETVVIAAVGLIAGLPIWIIMVGAALRFFHLWPFSN